MKDNCKYRYLSGDRLLLHVVDRMEAVGALQTNIYDSIVTDPPFADPQSLQTRFWRRCFHVLKPGGHLLVATGTVLQHQIASRIEGAGFDIRDVIGWVGGGQPRSLDVSRKIAKLAGEKEGLKWAGWGTTLRPAMKLVTLARKPFEGTVASNVLRYGTGALNIEGCRTEGRWPANFTHDGSGPRYYYSTTTRRDPEDMWYPERKEFTYLVPTGLMRFLCRLATPVGGTVFDPFMAIGTVGKAAVLERLGFTGIEESKFAFVIAKKRIKWAVDREGGLL